ADLDRELDGLTTRVAFGARLALLAPVFAFDKTLPAASAILLVRTTVGAVRAQRPFEFVHALRVHEVLVHGAFGEIRDGAITRVIQGEDALIRLATIDVARVRDDPEHRGIVERVDGDALEPDPAAVPMPEPV